MSPATFTELAPTPATHFTLQFYSAVAWLMAGLSERRTDRSRLREQFPFLEGYERELARRETARLTPHEAAEWWHGAVARWEVAFPGFLPVRTMGDAAGLERDAIRLLFAAGLVEEDARFGLVFEALDPLQGRRPTAGVLTELFGDRREGRDVRAMIARLRTAGLLRVANPDAPRAEWALHVPGVVWDAVQGSGGHEQPPWARFHALDDLPCLEDLVLPPELKPVLAQVPALLQSGATRALVLRGPLHNGRHTIARAVARALGCAALEIDGAGDEERRAQAGLLALAWRALPVLAVNPLPGDTLELPLLGAYGGPLVVVAGPRGGLHGPAVERAVTVAIDIPPAAIRVEHWRRSAPLAPADTLQRLGERVRLTSGNIRRAAALADSAARLAGRDTIADTDVRQAGRSLHREVLDTLATPVNAVGGWAQLAVRDDTLRELMELEVRCRHRERLAVAAGDAAALAPTCGVRALFRGPSGTGKTLAARLLASSLELDLYRLDLASLVNKYIGETEKSLDRVLSRAEELGVILLLDEGDALLTQRTSVQTSNDRYANLETNFLLQRLETFEGILLVTTNAGDRIDAAFERRMDVVVDFRAPDAAERWDVWQLHLPSDHRVDPDFLDEAASRCVMSGGQIRNAVLHASLLAIESRGPLTTSHLDAAVRREYRKAGGVCPLRRAESSWAMQE